MYTAMFQLRPNCGRIRRTYFRPVARTGVGESMSRMTRFARQPIAKKTGRKASGLYARPRNGRPAHFAAAVSVNAVGKARQACPLVHGGMQQHHPPADETFPR